MTAKASQKANAYYVSFDGVDITKFILNFDPGEDGAYVESTAGNDGLQSQFKIRDSVAPTASMEFVSSAADATAMGKLKKGTAGQLVWGPEGSGSGKPKWGIDAEVKRAKRVMQHGDRLLFDVEWVNTARDWAFDGATDTF